MVISAAGGIDHHDSVVKLSEKCFFFFSLSLYLFSFSKKKSVNSIWKSTIL